MELLKYYKAERIDRVFEAVLTNRLYCCDFTKLNDPMEGIFRMSSIGINQNKASRMMRDIVEKKQKCGICSLSDSDHNYLLWAHYASGFKGVAISIVLPENIKTFPIKYYPSAKEIFLKDYNVEPSRIVERVLTAKLTIWKYENEQRILLHEHANEHISICGIQRIILGYRMEPALKMAFQSISETKHIPLFQASVSGIEADVICEQYHPTQ